MNREQYEKHIEVVMETIDNPSTRLEKNGREFKEDIDNVVKLDNLVRAHEQLDQNKKEHIDEMNFKTAKFEYEKSKDEAERMERLDQKMMENEIRKAELDAQMKLEELKEANRHEEALAQVEADKHGAVMDMLAKVGNGCLWLITVGVGAYAEREGIISKGIVAIGDLFTRRS